MIMTLLLNFEKDNFKFVRNRNFQFVGLLIDRRHLVLHVLVVSENILKK